MRIAICDDDILIIEQIESYIKTFFETKGLKRPEIAFTEISDSYVLSPALNWMLTLSAVFLLAINLLIFGIEQYNRKKVWNLQKCNYCSKRSQTPHNITKCCFPSMRIKVS